MQENFRQFLDRLRQAGELVDLHQPVDIRHIATLVDQAKTALFFHKVIGYDMPVVSGIIRTQERAMMSMHAENYREIEDKLQQAINKPIAPKTALMQSRPRGVTACSMGPAKNRRANISPDVYTKSNRPLCFEFMIEPVIFPIHESVPNST